VSGRLILTSTTGAHDTAVSLTAVLFFAFCKSRLRNQNQSLFTEKVRVNKSSMLRNEKNSLVIETFLVHKK
jgi:hypothetical protein